MTNGIDISGWQGTVDFEKVKKSGVEFVVIKAGYAVDIVDSFEYNYRNAKAAGLHIGAYWYSVANSADEVKAEAAAFVGALSGKRFDYPAYLDFEEQSLFDRGKTFCSNAVNTFCGRLQQAGYLSGLYISRSPMETYISDAVAERYELWIAEHGPKCNYAGNYGMWQYSADGSCPGISGSVDLDRCYVDYPKIIEEGGFNGFGIAEPPKLPQKTAEQTAAEVIRGDWGNGDERRRRLTAAGYDFSEIQALVNELL